MTDTDPRLGLIRALLDERPRVFFPHDVVEDAQKALDGTFEGDLDALLGEVQELARVTRQSGPGLVRFAVDGRRVVPHGMKSHGTRQNKAVGGGDGSHRERLAAALDGIKGCCETLRAANAEWDARRERVHDLLHKHSVERDAMPNFQDEDALRTFERQWSESHDLAAAVRAAIS